MAKMEAKIAEYVAQLLLAPKFKGSSTNGVFTMLGCYKVDYRLMQNFSVVVSEIIICFRALTFCHTSSHNDVF